MKKTLFSLLMAGLFATASYANSSAGHHSVTDVAKAENYSNVTLKGKIIAQVDDKRYLFQDKTGTIELKADNKKQKNLQVSDSQQVLVYGKVDRYGKKTEIEVKSITPQKP